MKNILYAIKQFFQSVKNLVVWLPVIWEDRQWDQHYFYLILRKKLERMELFYRGKSAYGMYSYKEAENIRYCIDRLNRLIEQNYLIEALIPFDQKFPDYSWDIETRPLENGMSEWISKDTPEESELRHECYNVSTKMENDDLDELFAQIRLHVQEWWD